MYDKCFSPGCELETDHDGECVRDPDYDPTPWCTGCLAYAEWDCDCGPRADNE